MIRKSDYPLSFDFIENRPEETKEVFVKLTPHKGVFIGTCVIEGSFLCENGEELFGSLLIGEELLVLTDDVAKPNIVTPLLIKRKDGTLLGNVSFQSSVLPQMLLSRGIKLFAFCEAKSIRSGLLEVAVSLYCEKY